MTVNAKEGGDALELVKFSELPHWPYSICNIRPILMSQNKETGALRCPSFLQ